MPMYDLAGAETPTPIQRSGDGLQRYAVMAAGRQNASRHCSTFPASITERDAPGAVTPIACAINDVTDISKKNAVNSTAI